jgi:transposase
MRIPSRLWAGQDSHPTPLLADTERVLGHLGDNLLADIRLIGYNNHDIMPPQRRRRLAEDTKAAALRAAGALHPRPDTVQDDAFVRHEFFDRRDRVQVKYEMLRRHRVDRRPVTDVASAFGVSRQAFYAAEAAFTTAGLPGLLPRPRGPQRAHKCTDEILDFVEQHRGEDPARSAAGWAAAVRERFGVAIHPRSLTRALGRRKKNGAARAGRRREFRRS